MYSTSRTKFNKVFYYKTNFTNKDTRLKVLKKFTNYSQEKKVRLMFSWLYKTTLIILYNYQVFFVANKNNTLTTTTIK